MSGERASATEEGRVSVVIPTYYRNERLRGAIDSALAQEWPVEVIVVDGSGEAHAWPAVREFGGAAATEIAVGTAAETEADAVAEAEWDPVVEAEEDLLADADGDAVAGIEGDPIAEAEETAAGFDGDAVTEVEGDGGTGPGARRGADVTYVAQETDEGPHAARSVGAGYADGEYVQFLDDDDRLLPGKFAAQVPRFSADVGVVYSGLIDEEWGVCEPRPDVRGDVLPRTLEMRTFPAVPSTMLIDRSVVEALRPFEHRHGADDSGMKIELAKRTAFDYVDEPLVRRGRPGGDGESLSDTWAHVEGRRYVLERYADLYERFPPDVERTARCWTDYRAGNKHLEERPWSPRAVASFARAAYHAPEDGVRFAAATVASLLGRPGRRLADRLWSLP